MVLYRANNYPAARRIAKMLHEEGYVNVSIRDYRNPEAQKAKYYVTARRRK